MELELTEAPDKLAVYRQQVAEEKTDPRNKMSEAAKANLCSLNEHSRQNDEADLRLVMKLTTQSVTLEQLVDLFAKSFGGPATSPRRRAVKAMYRLADGAVLTSVTDLVILGELLPGEGVMPMHRFLVRYPLPEDETVLPKGEQPVVKKVKVVPCASGLKCIWVKRNKPAPATGRSRYCTKVCAQSDLARQRRLTVTPTAPEVVGSLLATA